MATPPKKKKKAPARSLVLVVEPIAVWRYGLEQVLEADGRYRVQQARSAAAMLAACAATPAPDVVLVQLQMDDMDGFVAMAQVRTKYPHLPCMAMAYKPTNEQVRRALRVEAKAVVCCTTEPTELCAQLSVVLQGGRPANDLLLRQLDAPEHRELARLSPTASLFSVQEWRCVKAYCTTPGATVVSVAKKLSMNYACASTYLTRARNKRGAATLRHLLEMWNAGALHGR